MCCCSCCCRCPRALMQRCSGVLLLASTAHLPSSCRQYQGRTKGSGRYPRAGVGGAPTPRLGVPAQRVPAQALNGGMCLLLLRMTMQCWQDARPGACRMQTLGDALMWESTLYVQCSRAGA